MGAVIAVVLLTSRGHLPAAVLLGAAVFGIAQARSLSPDFAGWLESTLARVARAMAHGVGLALSWVSLSVVFALVVLPVSLLGLAFRRPLGRPRGPGGDGWIPRGAMGRSAPVQRAFGAEPGRVRPDSPRPDPVQPDPVQPDPVQPDRRRRRLRMPRLATVLAAVAALLIADLAGGALLSAAGMAPEDRGDTARDVERAVATTMRAAPIASEPWVDDYREALVDLQLSGETYVPFLVHAPRPFQSRYLNTTDRERVSYRPPLRAGADPLRVAFFGGSVMFGVGQRDEHTIPSEIARLAEAEGVTLEVHNYGLPGWVSWQEFQYLERLLASGEQYDLVVFYDGFNEFLVQQTGFSPDPTHLGAGTMSAFATEYHREHETEPGVMDSVREVTSAYARFSATGRVIDRFRGGDGPQGEGELTSTASPEQQADAALEVYGRSTRMVGDLVDDRDTPVRFFWQPTKAGWEPRVTDGLPAGVTDVSHTLDGREEDLYIDEVHTNEEGARLMAEALWAELGPELEEATAAR